MRLLQEAVGLIGVREVGRSADHVGHLLSKHAENGCRSATCGSTSLLLNGCPVDLRSLAAEPLFQESSLVGILLCPLCLLSIALGADLLQLLSTLCVEFLHLGEYLEGILWIGTEVLHRLHEVVAAKRSTMCSAVALVAGAVGLTGTLTHDAMTDDERRTLLLGLSLAESLANLVDIVAVDVLYEPSPSLILLSGVLAGHHFRTGGELDVVGIVEHDEVVETQVTGDTASALRDFLLHTTVRDVCIDGLIHHVAQASLQELSSDSSTHGEGVALSERTAGVLDAACDFALGVTGSDASPLTQVLQVLQRVLADEAELRVEHRGHVAGI